jgi:hypothetical protein
MRKIGLFTLLLTALCLGNAQAQDPQAALRALFPATNQVAGWALKQEPKFYTSMQVFDYMDGAGEIPRSYDLRGLASARYTRGNVTLEVVAFDMGRSENAFGYYSARAFLERSPSAKERVIALDNPANLYAAVGILTLWKGRYTVIVQPDVGKPDEQTLVAFGRFVSGRIHEASRRPALLARLKPHGPGVGAAGASVRYLRGKAAFDTQLLFTPKDAFGGGMGAEAVAAEFPVMGAPTTLCIIRYPDASGATAALGRFQQFLAARKAVVSPTHLPNAVVATLPRFKGVGAMVVGNTLEVVVSAKDAGATEAGLRSLLPASTRK